MTDERDVEREIGRVLEGLRGVEAPLGLEGRVLARVAEARARRKSVGWLRGVALALAACGVAGMVWVWGGGAGRVVVGDNGSAGAGLAAQNSARADAGRRDWQVGGDGLLDAPRGSAERRGTPRAVSEPKMDARAEEAIALEEMRAPSMPEAPIPMTAQERLLVRMAQNRGAEALAKTEYADKDGGSAGSGDEVQVPVKGSETRDVALVLRAGLFAGMSGAPEVGPEYGDSGASAPE